MKEKFVLVERATGAVVDVYMNVRAHNQMFFDSADEARTSNGHGIYKDKTKFAVRKVEINAIEDDVDPPTEQEKESAKRNELREAKLNKEADEMGLFGCDRINWLAKKDIDVQLQIEAIQKQQEMAHKILPANGKIPPLQPPR